jgi:predicted ATP-binding protein involved in virulence
MRLKSVAIWNFRAIGELQLELDPHLTVLIAKNASGKTCTLDAISLALAAILTRCPEVSGLDFSDTNIRRVGRGKAEAALVRLETTEGVVWDRSVFRDSTKRTRSLFLKKHRRKGTAALRRHLDPIIFSRTSGDEPLPLPVLAYYGTDRAVVTLPERRRNFRAEHDAFEALRDALRPTGSFKAMFEWFLAVESEELREQRDRRDTTWQHPQLAAVRKAVEQVIPGSRNLRVETRPLRLAVKLKNSVGVEEDLTLNELSGGYRTLLAVVADLARRMAQANPTLGTDSEAIVLIDEVDLHLHPEWQQTVLDSLLRAFPNAQFIVTTHSDQVIASVEAKQVVRLDRVADGVVASRPSSTYGATPDRVVEDVMGVSHLRPAKVMETLGRYWALITAGEGESPEALRIRETLDGWFRGEEPEMIRADAEIKRKKMLQRLRGAP